MEAIINHQYEQHATKNHYSFKTMRKHITLIPRYVKHLVVRVYTSL